MYPGAFVIRVDDERVEVRKDVFFTADFLLDEVVGAFVGEDDVDAFGRAADVRAEHDVVRRVAVHARLIEVRTENFDVAAAAIDALLVFDLKLNDEWLALVAEGLEFRRDAVEASILRSLQTFVGFLVVVKFAGAQTEDTHFRALRRRRNPSLRECISVRKLPSSKPSR